MKLLLVLLVVLFGVWLWRSRRLDGKRARPTPPSPPAPAAIVACDVCGVHLPQADALTSATGVYCSHAHRQQAQR